MLPMEGVEPVKYCDSCGLPIFVLWVFDPKSDRDNDTYLHMGCLRKDDNENIVKSSN